MRFLVVFKNYAEEARKLVRELGVRDAEVVVLGNGRRVEDKAAVRQLSAERGASTATVSVNRKLQQSLEDDFGCKLEINVASIQGARTDLVNWLLPPAPAQLAEVDPAEALLAAARADARVVIAHNALLYANDLADHRHGFVGRAATALKALAEAGCSAPGGLEQYFGARGLQFAVNGPVAVTVQVYSEGKQVDAHTTEWHLKEGDSTTRAAAARLYFCFNRYGGTSRVLVLYCGPHPEGGLTVFVFI